MTYDLVVRGGEIIDGTGKPRYHADLGVQGDRIAKIGANLERGRREIDARGCVVTPGFIDGHTHFDAQINWEPLCTSSSLQGVTTVVMGNCGFTLAPSRANQRALVVRNLERAEDMSAEALALGIKWNWETFPEYLDYVDQLPKALNHAVYVGHSALRTYVMGEHAFEREATEDELTAMSDQLMAGIDAGAIGFSSSRNDHHETSDDRPVASRVAAWSEVRHLVAALGRAGKGVFELAPGTEEAELEELAVETRVPVMFGVGQAGGVDWRGQLELLDRVAKRGGRMVGQSHSRGITLLLSFQAHLPFDKLPSWKAFRGLPIAEQERLLRTDPELRARLIDGANHEEYAPPSGAEPWKPDWDLLVVRSGPFPPYASLADLARVRQKNPVEIMIDLALQSPNLSQLFMQLPGRFPEDELLTVLKHPRTVMTFSDTGAHVSQICDCSIHTHLLSYWVRERKAFTLEEAVHMITQTPAATWGFHERGLLREGLIADVNVFDPQAITALEPKVVNDLPGGASRFVQDATGIRATIVNGQVLMQDGKHTGVLPGRLLRSAHGSA
jgi:N-acyl-D-amino-acid deacylase